MSPRFSLVVVVASVLLAGCSVMEQNHFPQTQENVPVKVVIAFSQAYPNDTIKEIVEQKMFDGTVHYKFMTNNTKAGDRTVAFSQDGQEIKDPL